MKHEFAFGLGDYHYKFGSNCVNMFNVPGSIIARRSFLKPFPHTEYDVSFSDGEVFTYTYGQKATGHFLINSQKQ